jgi:autotransporter-associated beta strand protein
MRSTTSNRTLGPLTLNGGTLSIANVNTTSFEPFGFSADLSVTGSSPSAISAVTGGGINLTANAAANSQRTFNVADVTGDANVDLTVSAILADSASSSAAAGLIKAGAGTMAIIAANIYTGPTTINNGAFLVDGSIGSGNVTVNSGGILGGNGTIRGTVNVQSGATIQPGLGGADTSTLTITNTLTLAGNTIFVLNRTNTQTSSRIIGVTTLNQGGTLTVNNAGDQLQSGDTFTLFNASSYTGNFAATNLPALLPGLSWSNNISGTAFTAQIIGQVKLPTIKNISFSGGDMVFSWTNGVAGQSYRVLTSTNIGLPMSNWTPIVTNIFSVDGGYTNIIPIDGTRNAGFFRVVEP